MLQPCDVRSFNAFERIMGGKYLKISAISSLMIERAAAKWHAEGKRSATITTYLT